MLHVNDLSCLIVFRCLRVNVVVMILGFMYNLHSKCLMKCLNEFFIDFFNFLLCRFEAMAGWIDVHAQFNDG